MGAFVRVEGFEPSKLTGLSRQGVPIPNEAIPAFVQGRRGYSILGLQPPRLYTAKERFWV